MKAKRGSVLRRGRPGVDGRRLRRGGVGEPQMVCRARRPSTGAARAGEPLGVGGRHASVSKGAVSSEGSMLEVASIRSSTPPHIRSRNRSQERIFGLTAAPHSALLTAKFFSSPILPARAEINNLSVDSGWVLGDGGWAGQAQGPS